MAPNGSISAHIYNPTGTPIRAAVTVNGWGNRWQLVSVPAWGTVTMHQSDDSRINRSPVPDDEEFVLDIPASGLMDDKAPGKS